MKQQVIQNRVKRQYSSPSDPGWNKQWSLVCIKSEFSYAIGVCYMQCVYKHASLIYCNVHVLDYKHVIIP